MMNCPKCGGKIEVTKEIVAGNDIYEKCVCCDCNFVYGVEAKHNTSLFHEK